jgi:hypothetical protein
MDGQHELTGDDPRKSGYFGRVIHLDGLNALISRAVALYRLRPHTLLFSKKRYIYIFMMLWTAIIVLLSAMYRVASCHDTRGRLLSNTFNVSSNATYRLAAYYVN